MTDRAEGRMATMKPNVRISQGLTSMTNRMYANTSSRKQPI